MSTPEELRHLDTVFQANGFPAFLVKKTLTAPPKAPRASTEDSEPSEPQGTLYTQYV